MKDNRHRYIELDLREMSQLFNSMDPSPFNEKDLDHDAEEFIMNWAQEYPSKDPLILRVHLTHKKDGSERIIQEAVHHYFSYRPEAVEMEFRQLMRQARSSFFIGILFLAACLASAYALEGHLPEGPWREFLREGFTIAGWVAMWRPLQMYLYDWWPVRRQIQLYQKLSRMPVEVTQKKIAE